MWSHPKQRHCQAFLQEDAEVKRLVLCVGNRLSCYQSLSLVWGFGQIRLLWLQTLHNSDCVIVKTGKKGLLGKTALNTKREQVPCVVECPRLDPGCGGTGTGVSVSHWLWGKSPVFVCLTKDGINFSDRGFCHMQVLKSWISPRKKDDILVLLDYSVSIVKIFAGHGQSWVRGLSVVHYVWE